MLLLAVLWLHLFSTDLWERRLTSICIVEVHKLLPSIIGQETKDGPLKRRAHLDDKLDVRVDWITGCDEGSVEGTAEGGQSVHGLFVIEAEDGIDSSGELRADCNRAKMKGRERKRQRALARYKNKDKTSSKTVYTETISFGNHESLAMKLT